MEKNKPSFLSCAKRQQRWAIRKLSIGVCSVLLGVMLMVPSLGTVYAQENRGLDTTTHYTATGIDNNANLRYSSTVFNKVEDDGSLSMTFTYWFSGSAGWGTDPANEYAGKYLLSFTNDTFYKQIDKVILDDISLEKHSDGAMWSLPVTKLPNYALIGVSRNQPVKITLKNGQTLESLNLQDTPIGFNSILTTTKGAIASNSISNGYILQNNNKNKNEKESGFTKGKVNQRIKFNVDDMTIRSIHTFKPNENFLQTDYSWVVYVKEQIPPELLPYIDTDNIKIYCSDLDGVKINENHEEFTVPINDQGLVDTSQVPELSIIDNDTKAQLDAARKNLDRIFFGTLGQSRNYTISYKLKDSVTLSDFARAANEYIEKNQQSFLFDSWMEADYLNTKQGISTNDNGDAPKQLNDSYANAYLDANDTDKDGLFDFVEWKIGTDTTKVDTDGDGIPDGQEFMTDQTEPNNAADYLVSKPTTTTTTFDSTKKTTIEGTVPKPLIADPADPARLIQITNEDAGNVIVKLQGYDKDKKTYNEQEYGTTKISFDDLVAGNFSLDVNANVVPDGTEVVLVAYSPNADNPVMGDPFTFTTPDKDKYDAKGGTLNQDYGKKAEEAAILDKVTVTETKDGQEAPAPAEKVKSKAIKGEIPTPTADGADQTVTVEVTYADGTKEDATVTIAYGEAKDAYAPEGQKVDVNKGEDPSAEAGIKNKDDLPEGTTYDWKTPVDTDTPGETTGTIVVTYPDGSKEEVEVTVNVVDTTPQATDTELYTAQGGVVNKPYGQTATNDEVIAEVTTDAPDEKVKSREVVDAIPTTGQNQPVNVKVTYVDGTNDTVIVTVNYGLATDAYDPAGQAITVDKGSQPNAADGIANKADLPANTTYGWAAPVDTSTPGTTSGTIVVTYPDGSTDQVTVDVIVNENATDTELYTAQGGVVNKPYGQTATNDEVIGVVTTDAPAEKIQSIVAVDAIPTTGQNQPVNVKVTYADGSNDTVIVTVNYGLATDAYDPAGQAITVDKGSQPNAADGIANKADLPANTTYGWAAPVDTGTPGTTSGTVVVTYTDGSTDQVTVDVIVNDNRTDAEKYTPEGQEVNVNKGETPNPEDGIRNKDDLPEDTKYEWKEPIDTETPGETTGTIVVTYPDGTTDEVEVTVNVIDPRTDADKYTPEGQDVKVDTGEKPNPEDGIKNKDDLPEDTKYEWKTPVDTDKPGETPGIIVVTYPDGTTEEVEVKVNVTDPRTDADKYDPETKPEIIKPGENPDLTDNVTNLEDLPEGTKIKDITPEGVIDPNKPGEYEGTLEIQYPDGSKETVTVKVTVEKPASTVTPVNNQQNTQTNKVTKVTTSGPKTGDFTNLGVHTAAAIGSIATLAGLFFVRKRRKVDEKQ